MSKITAQFIEQFNKDKVRISEGELTVKELLSLYSRNLLDLLHNDTDDQGENICDIRMINEIIDTLRTKNKDVAILYFQHFTGFRFDSVLGKFTGKDKPTYAEKKEKAIDFLTDPHNNLWSWADREVKIEPKAFDLKKVTKFIESSIKKADKEGINKADLIKAILAGGITEAELVEVMGFMIEA